MTASKQAQALAAVVLLVTCSQTHGQVRGSVNDRPIIGIFTQPAEVVGAAEYIAGSYIKFIEAGGARVVPIRYTLPKEEILDLLGRINGVLLPGGGTELDPGHEFYDALTVMWKFALQKKTLPVFGTCLGFEALVKLGANSKPVLRESGEFDAEAYPQPVQFSPEAENSTLFAGLNPSLKAAMEAKDITYNAHMQGITPEVFESNQDLSELFTVLGYAKDRKGKKFVAMVEAKGYPIYGVQFHPEKANFEWIRPSTIPHTREAIAVSQYLANFFVDQARKNMNRFSESPKVESKALIENYTRKYLGNSYFSEIFLFGAKDALKVEAEA